MAKKRHNNEQELPFVALMDTMTNVVGVLTIVLVMMGISLARAASKVLSALPPATEAQVRAAQAALDRMRADEASLREKLKEMAKPELTPAELAAREAELARLKQALEEKGIKPLDLDALGRTRAKYETELKQKKAAVDQLMVDRDRFKALLDETPVSKAPPAKVVRIPVSRPIPEGARIEHILVTKDGAHPFSIQGAKAVLLNLLKSPSNRDLVFNKINRDKKMVVIYDYQKLLHYLEKEKLAYREFHIDVIWVDWSSSPILRLRPEGPSPAGLRGTLDRFKNTPRTVVMFHVTGDGFENYLAARKECDAAGVPAGWEFTGAPEYSFHTPELETNKPKPPPPKPAPPAPPSSEIQIKPPAQKLD
jgi:hypothetical protein